jgi:hydrogenase expression/formation protein HypC
VCLAVPGRIDDVWQEGELRMGRVDFGGVRKAVCLETLPEARVGTWVLVHAGVALQALDPDAAAESLRLLAEAAALGEEP